jgi:hypothetical protein
MPKHSGSAGSIILPEAFALGKMMQSESWRGLLRDNIIPSDIDLPEVPLCFDNRGSIIFVDFSRSFNSWQTILGGQRQLYEALIRTGSHCAVLCKHDVAPEMGRYIDTLRDVDTFQVMFWDFEPVISPLYSGAYWQHFVCKWVNNKRGPFEIRRRILGLSAGMIRAQPVSHPPT